MQEASWAATSDCSSEDGEWDEEQDREPAARHAHLIGVGHRLDHDRIDAAGRLHRGAREAQDVVAPQLQRLDVAAMAEVVQPTGDRRIAGPADDAVDADHAQFDGLRPSFSRACLGDTAWAPSSSMMRLAFSTSWALVASLPRSR